MWMKRKKKIQKLISQNKTSKIFKTRNGIGERPIGIAKQRKLKDSDLDKKISSL